MLRYSKDEFMILSIVIFILFSTPSTDSQSTDWSMTRVNNTKGTIDPSTIKGLLNLQFDQIANCSEMCSKDTNCMAIWISNTLSIIQNKIICWTVNSNNIDLNTLNGTVYKINRTRLCDTCLTGWKPYPNNSTKPKSCFVRFNITANFNNSASICEKYNAMIAFPDSKEQGQFIADNFKIGASSNWDGNPFIGIWGITQKGTQNIVGWQWINGTNATYLNWNPGEPNNPDTERCVQLAIDPFPNFKNSTTKMNNCGCNNNLSGVLCEYALN